MLVSRSSTITDDELTRRRPNVEAVSLNPLTIARKRTSSEARCSWLSVDKSGFSRRLERPRTRPCALLVDPERQYPDSFSGSATACRTSRYALRVSSWKGRLSEPVVHRLKCCHSTRQVSKIQGWRCSKVAEPTHCPLRCRVPFANDERRTKPI